MPDSVLRLVTGFSYPTQIPGARRRVRHGRNVRNGVVKTPL
jgi:hypothetical protein